MFDDERLPKLMILPCGGKAFLDPESSTYGYRCDTCFAIVRSIGQPDSCVELLDYWNEKKSSEGTGWDFKRGVPENHETQKNQNK